MAAVAGKEMVECRACLSVSLCDVSFAHLHLGNWLRQIYVDPDFGRVLSYGMCDMNWAMGI